MQLISRPQRSLPLSLLEPKNYRANVVRAQFFALDLVGAEALQRVAAQVFECVSVGMTGPLQPDTRKRQPSASQLIAIGSLVVMLLQHEDFFNDLKLDELGQRWASGCNESPAAATSLASQESIHG